MIMHVFLRVALAISLFLSVNGNVFLHSPRGSNNRLDEETRDTYEQDRLFNSENVRRGGYGVNKHDRRDGARVPRMRFEERSFVPLAWTHQSMDGAEKKLILQFMCTRDNTVEPLDSSIRDGRVTSTIPFDNTWNDADDGGFKYGMQESRNYYGRCRLRERNRGLFTPFEWFDENDDDDSARLSKASRTGHAHGFECPEERDYYPYWAPTPWHDIAVFLGDKNDDESLQDACDMYRNASQNVALRYECVGGALWNTSSSSNPPVDVASVHNHRTACEAANFTWSEVRSAWRAVEPPACGALPPSPLGLSNTMSPMHTYQWRLPSVNDLDECADVDEAAGDTCVCVVRARFNVSAATNDSVAHWWRATRNTTFANVTGSGSESNGAADGVLALAVNYPYYDRVFQDRTHTFELRRAARDIGGGGGRGGNDDAGGATSPRLWNVVVAGKRGLIDDMYPALQYTFVPQVLRAAVGDYVHIQWTGFDRNDFADNGDEGEGKQHTDRHNVMQIRNWLANEPLSEAELSDGTWNEPILFGADEEGGERRREYAFLEQADCRTHEELLVAHSSYTDIANDDRNCYWLNAAPAYFEGRAVPLGNATGSIYYMSTRNNNFGVRTQKARIDIVSEQDFLRTFTPLTDGSTPHDNGGDGDSAASPQAGTPSAVADDDGAGGELAAALDALDSARRTNTLLGIVCALLALLLIASVLVVICALTRRRRQQRGSSGSSVGAGGKREAASTRHSQVLSSHALVDATSNVLTDEATSSGRRKAKSRNKSRRRSAQFAAAYQESTARGGNGALAPLPLQPTPPPRLVRAVMQQQTQQQQLHNQHQEQQQEPRAKHMYDRVRPQVKSISPKPFGEDDEVVAIERLSEVSAEDSQYGNLQLKHVAANARERAESQYDIVGSGPLRVNANATNKDNYDTVSAAL